MTGDGAGIGVAGSALSPQPPLPQGERGRHGVGDDVRFGSRRFENGKSDNDGDSTTRPPYTENERWYLALTALWARSLRDGDMAGRAGTAEPEVRFAASVLGLAPGARVLDLACGWGRTTLELARQGYRVTGVDISPELLAIAREHADAAGLVIPFIEATVRALPDLGTFDAVTAFYDDSPLSFEGEHDNVAALACIARALRPDGRALFGTTDCPLILPPVQRSTRMDGDVRLDEEITFDRATLTGTSVRTHLHPDSTRTRYRRVRRHYTPESAAPLFRAAGLTITNAWCAYDPALPYGARPEGMVLLAERRPEREGTA